MWLHNGEQYGQGLFYSLCHVALLPAARRSGPWCGTVDRCTNASCGQGRSDRWLLLGVAPLSGWTA